MSMVGKVLHDLASETLFSIVCCSLLFKLIFCNAKAEVLQSSAAAAKVTSVVSDSVWPHRRKPVRLLHPWDSPGKNTGVGTVFWSTVIETYFDFLSCLFIRIGDEAFGVWKWSTFLPILKVFICVAVVEGGRMRWRRWRSVGNSVAPSWASSWETGL